MRVMTGSACLIGFMAYACAAAGQAPGAEHRIRDKDELERLEERRALLINGQTFKGGNGNADTDDGKRTWSPLLAEMWKDRENKGALKRHIDGDGKRYAFSRYAGSYYKAFSAPGHSFYYFLLKEKDLLPQNQAKRMRRAGSDWDKMMRKDGKMDPIYNLSEFNSENFNWMARMAGVLWSHELDNRGKQQYFDQYLDNLTRALYNAGRVEWNSNNYWGHTFNPILPLYEFAPTDKIKRQAAAIADWMIAEAAVHYLDGFQVGADTRAKTGAYKPFAGSIWAYSYLYFADQDAHPTFPKSALSKHRFKSEAGYIAWTSYRPLRAMVALAQRKYKTPVEIQCAKPFYNLDNDNYAAWRGTGKGRRNEFETLYLGRDYTLASLATLRPHAYAEVRSGGAGGNNKPFCEQSVWRLGVRGRDFGALQVYGNAGPEGGWGKGYDTMAGRQAHEQIGQYGPVMMRLWTKLDRAWIAVPTEFKVEQEPDGRLFCDMGHDAYFAIVPFAAVKNSKQAIKGRRGKPGTHDRYVWNFNPARLGGLVLEVGTRAQHGSLGGFKRAIAGTQLRPVGADGLSYQATDGRVLKMRHTGTTTYRLIDGSTVSPAGKLPEVWRDGSKVDFMSWDSYRVVAGEPIIEQKWGSGVMDVRAGGEHVRITVDPRTADVTWE